MPSEESSTIDEATITVCSSCFRASCWHGYFMCDAAKWAGTVEKTEEELRKLNLEHPCYWEDHFVIDGDAVK